MLTSGIGQVEGPRVLSHGPGTPYSLFDGTRVVPVRPLFSITRATLSSGISYTVSSVYVEPVSDYVYTRTIPDRACYSRSMIDRTWSTDRFDRGPISHLCPVAIMPLLHQKSFQKAGRQRPLSPASGLRHVKLKVKFVGKDTVLRR